MSKKKVTLKKAPTLKQIVSTKKNIIENNIMEKENMTKEDTNPEGNFNIEEENTIREGTNTKVDCVPLKQTTLKTTSLKRRAT